MSRHRPEVPIAVLCESMKVRSSSTTPCRSPCPATLTSRSPRPPLYSLCVTLARFAASSQSRGGVYPSWLDTESGDSLDEISPADMHPRCERSGVLRPGDTAVVLIGEAITVEEVDGDFGDDESDE